MESGKWYKLCEGGRIEEAPPRKAIDPVKVMATTGGFPISEIFYTQKSIASRFHDGSRVCPENIKSHWVLRVTQAPSGQWFTLNNRLLFAHNMENWPENAPDERKHLMLILLNPDKVKVEPFHDVKEEFRSKFTSDDNGNTCYIRSPIGNGRSKDWLCSKWVHRALYEKFILSERDPLSSHFPFGYYILIATIVVTLFIAKSLAIADKS